MEVPPSLMELHRKFYHAMEDRVVDIITLEEEDSISPEDKVVENSDRDEVIEIRDDSGDEVIEVEDDDSNTVDVEVITKDGEEGAKVAEDEISEENDDSESSLATLLATFLEACEVARHEMAGGQVERLLGAAAVVEEHVEVAALRRIVREQTALVDDDPDNVSRHVAALVDRAREVLEGAATKAGSDVMVKEVEVRAKKVPSTVVSAEVAEEVVTEVVAAAEVAREPRVRETATKKGDGGKKRVTLISCPRTAERAVTREEGGRRRVQMTTTSTTRPVTRSMASITSTPSTNPVAPPSSMATLSPKLAALAAEIRRVEEQVVEGGDEGRHLSRLDRLRRRFRGMVSTSITTATHASAASPSRYVV